MADGKNNRLSGIHPLSYMGVNAAQPSNTVNYNRPPTANDYRNFKVGDRWIDDSASPEELWTLVSLAANVATWSNLSGGDTGAETFPTDAGTAVPAANALTVAGGNNISTAGAGSTVTVDLDANVPDSFTTDAGSAVPAANVLTVAGGNNISTAGAGSTVTVDLDGNVADTFQADVAFATPAANIITIAGGTSVTTTGAGSTVTIDVDADVPTTFAGDAGTATPAANVITIAGGTNVTTNAAGSTVTITASGGGGGGAANASFLAHQVADGGGFGSGGFDLGASVIMTEVYDVGGDFYVGDGAGAAATFTAPQDGKYLLTMTAKFTTSSALNTHTRYVEIQTSNRTYRHSIGDNINTATIANFNTLSFSVVADMDSSDTAEYFVYDADSSASIQGDVSGTGEYQTFVSGALQETDNMSFTEHAVLVGNATGGIGELALATDGQVLIGATGAASAWAGITAGANITVTPGANSISIASTAGGGSSTSSFLAIQPSAGGNAATVGGIYLGASVAMSEIFDVGGDFTPGDGAGTAAQFVAPETGRYFIQCAAWIQPTTSHSQNQFYINMESSNRTYWKYEAIILTGTTTNRWNNIINNSCLVDMDIGDTLEWRVEVTSGPATATLQGNATDAYTYVSGTLV